MAGMRDLLILFVHLIVTMARLAKPGGLRSVVAESAVTPRTNIPAKAQVRCSDRLVPHSRWIRSRFFFSFDGFFAVYHSGKGAFGEALHFAEKSYSLQPHLPEAAGLLAGLLIRNGDAARAQAILAKLCPPTAFGVPLGLARFHLITGEIEKAADWYERVIEECDGSTFAIVHGLATVQAPLRKLPLAQAGKDDEPAGGRIAMPSLAAGERLGPYEILAPIGSGGMGEVYKARDTRLDRIVGRKISKREVTERFRYEAAQQYK